MSAKELMLLNCGVGEDSWVSFELQETKPVNPKGNQSGIFIGRTDAEAKTPILWLPDSKSWFLKQTKKEHLILGKIEGRRKKGQQRTRWLYGITKSIDMSLSMRWGMVKGREEWCAAVDGVIKRHNWATEQQNIFKH